VQIAKLKSLLLKSSIADERLPYQKAYSSAALCLGELLLLPETKAPADAEADA
jgi:hypothetical protein